MAEQSLVTVTDLTSRAPLSAEWTEDGVKSWTLALCWLALYLFSNAGVYGLYSELILEGRIHALFPDDFLRGLLLKG